MSWQCFGSYFIPAKQSKSSIKFNKSIKDFLKDNTEEELRNFVKAIFEVLQKSDITSTETVTIKKIIKCVNYVRQLNTYDPKTKDKLLKLFNIVLALYTNK